MNLICFRECLKQDIIATTKNPTISFFQVVYYCFTEARVLAVVLFRISQYLWHKRFVWRLAPLIKRINEILTGFECHLEARIGKGLFLAHTQNIVIGEGAVLGENITLYNGVTIGAVKIENSRNNNVNSRYPTIQNDTVIYSGAKIIGSIKVGEGATIGANAVVLQDVPQGCVAVGIPAKNISKKH